ncbi:MAG: BatD family protein [Cytophagaceae bacterium]
MAFRLLVLLILQFTFFSTQLRASVVEKIVVDKDTVCLDELFKISLEILAINGRKVGLFPDIPDFTKRRTLYEKDGSIIRATQYYAPQKQGVYAIPDATMLVNGEVWNIKSRKIVVIAECEAPSDYIEARSDFEDVPADAFLSLKVSKEQVFSGESFDVSVSFCIAEDNKAELNFYDFKNQLQTLVRQIKNSDLWIEDFCLRERPSADSVFINGKKYFSYNFFTQKGRIIKEGNITIPSLSWKMTQYKLHKGQNYVDRKDTLVVFKTEPFAVSVRELPEHPLMDQVPVGVFRMEEQVSNQEIFLEEKSVLKIKITGSTYWSGTYSSILKNKKNLTVYAGDIVSLKSGDEYCKEFTFYLVPLRSGEHKLKDYFQWIYFNSEKNDYDTLVPMSLLKVHGEAIPLTSQLAFKYDEYYGKLEYELGKHRRNDYWDYINIFGNILLILLAFATLVFIFRR